MKDKINSIIDRYKNTEPYVVLKNYYVQKDINEIEYADIFNTIRKTLISYYLYKYKFKTYMSHEVQDDYLSVMIRYTNLTKRISFVGNEFKVYPIKASDSELLRNYRVAINSMVDYQLDNNLDIEEIFKLYSSKLEESFNEYKERLHKMNIRPYYGNASYIINRTRFIQECIKRIPGIDYNIDSIVNKMAEFEQKYMTGNIKIDRFTDDFLEVGEDFKKDFDKLEEYYKLALIAEEELTPVVMEYWKQYLTNPNVHDDSNYKYVMHTFSSGMVDPKLMQKACCAFNSDKLVVTPYGNCGLIYEMDASAVETICAEDVGSWRCDKKTFIDRDCPTSWQLTRFDSNNVWYEFECNSKLIMPNILEKECFEANVSCNGEMLNNSKSYCYSEIYLNNNARAIGVFYTDDCKNIEEVMKYAEMYNLPLIHISLAKQRELNGLAPLVSSKRF